MIEKTIGYKVGDHYFPTIEEAQKEEVLVLFSENNPTLDTSIIGALADTIVDNKDAILAIFSEQPKRKYTKRSAPVGKKKHQAVIDPPPDA